MQDDHMFVFKVNIWVSNFVSSESKEKNLKNLKAVISTIGV